MRFRSTLMLAAAFCFCHIQAAAADEIPNDDDIFHEPRTWVGADFGFATGGSDVLYRSFTHGKPNTDSTVLAGDSEYFDTHLTQDLWHSGFAVQVAAAYGDNGDISSPCQPSGSGGSLCAYTLQHAVYWGKVLYRFNDHWNIGVGRVFHRNIILESTDPANRFPDVDFRPAAGWILDLEEHQDNVFVGVRYTHILYHTVNGGVFANASSIGLYIGIEGALF